MGLLCVSGTTLTAVALIFAAPPAALAASAASALTESFAAANGRGWTGGDGAWSAPLPDGRTVWLFGDTFLGGVDDAGHRSAAAPMVHNSMVVEGRDGAMRTLAGGTAAAPDSLVAGSGANDWYWPGPPVAGPTELELPMEHVVRTGPGGWDFEVVGTALAEFALPSLTLRGLTPLATPPHVGMASAAVTAGR